ncbi:tudor domain-containing protein 3 [Neocloeon triangulifer]|uniref:tudor domain-containing protein 3 n=1 Tax=Neocloeon triangulifer TaxID=2078957 RepID=UPI00286F91B8|nr:tudor domain-containing protein 3 [Neocloeon triangulifer]
MAVAEKLRQEGWFLTPEGLELVTDNGNLSDIKAIIRRALDVDLKEISESNFIEEVVRSKVEAFEGHRVVQIQKIRNISAPKVNEESGAAPRMLKLLLTDGTSTCQAIEVEHLPSLSLNTPPGTKLRFKPGSIPVSHGFVQLKPSLLEFLGGRVAPLVEKWELNRTLAKHSRGRVGEEGGPPPWIPFGQKILKPQATDRNFKSLDTGEKDIKENPEFEAQRKDAIAEAARAGSKKVFGGGTKQMLDHNVQQIVNVGFSVSQAEYALKQGRNNIDRALKILQKGDESATTSITPTFSSQRGGKAESRGRKKGDREKDEDGVAAKPSGKVSLFDFLEDKLPIQKEPEKKNSNFFSERRDRKDFHREQNHGNSGGGFSGGGRGGRYQDNNWSRQNDRAGQKPPRFQQQAQRLQQRQQNFNAGKQLDSGLNSSYSTWSSGNNDFNSQWGSFSGLANESLSKDLFRSNNDDVGQWKMPPEPKGKRRPEAEAKSFQSPFHQKSSRQFSDFGAESRTSDVFGDTNHVPFSMGYSRNFQTPQNDVPSASALCEPRWEWHEGDKCMAKYWEDNRHYRAEVTGVSAKTVVVRFLEYGNFEEVLHEDCIPITEYD